MNDEHKHLTWRGGTVYEGIGCICDGSGGAAAIWFAAEEKNKQPVIVIYLNK